MYKELNSTYWKHNWLFLKYSKSMKNMKDENPLPQMSDNTWFVTFVVLV